MSIQINYYMTDFKNTFILTYTSRLVIENAKSMLARELDRAKKEISSSINKQSGINHENKTEKYHKLFNACYSYCTGVAK
jgi:hypothetical protein